MDFGIFAFGIGLGFFLGFYFGIWLRGREKPSGISMREMSNVMKEKPPRRAVEKPVTCSECKPPKTFLTTSLLTKHMHLVHGVSYKVKERGADF